MKAWQRSLSILFEGVAEELIDGNTEKGKTDMATPLSSLKKQFRVLATAKQTLSSTNGQKIPRCEPLQTFKHCLGGI